MVLFIFMSLRFVVFFFTGIKIYKMDQFDEEFWIGMGRFELMCEVVITTLLYLLLK